MSFFGAPTTTAASAFGTSTPSTGFSFGGGDAKPFGAATTENKAAFNFTSPTSNAPTFGGGGFSFGAKTATTTPSMFGTPTQPTTATSAFGAKPLNFGVFTSPPNQTVGSPGFGQTAPATAQNLSFASPAQQNAPAPSFGSPQTTQAQPAPSFGSPNTGFGFGLNKPTTTTGFGGFQTPASGFSNAQQPGTATTASAPQMTQSTLSFGAATTASSAFGLGTKPSFSFGPAAGQATPAPSFAPTTQSTGFSAATQPQSTASSLNFNPTPSFGAQTQAPTLNQTSLNFNQAQSTTATGLATTATGFSTPATGFATPATGFATPATGFSTTATGFSAPATGFSTTATTLAQTSQAQGLGFPKTSVPTTGFGFLQPQASLGGTQQAQVGFGVTTTNSATTQPSLSFAPKTSQPQATLSFPTTQSIVPSTQTSIQAPIQTSIQASLQTSMPSFNTTVATTGAGLNVGLNAFAKVTATGAPTSLPATKPITSFGLPSSQPSSTAATTTPSGIAALSKTTAGTLPSLTSTTTSVATSLPSLPSGPPLQIASLTFAQLEENINKWTIELEEQEKTFINQATQINAWDRLLIANGEKIVELNDAVQTVKNEEQSLEHELDFILAQQKELEELLAPLEKQLQEDTGDRMRDSEREMMYNLAENLDTQLRQMSEDLKEVIEHLNETNRSQDNSDPIVQIGRILNAHMSSMQWIDTSIAQISTKLDQLKATHDTLRRDNERSFQLTYN